MSTHNVYYDDSGISGPLVNMSLFELVAEKINDRINASQDWQGIIIELKNRSKSKDRSSIQNILETIKTQIKEEEPIINPEILNEGEIKNGVTCMVEVKGLLVVGAMDGRILLYSISSSTILNAPQQILDQHTDEITAVSVSADKNIIISASKDKSLRVWMISETEKDFILQQTLRDHDQQITSIKISHSSNILVSGSADNSLIIWSRASDVSDLQSLKYAPSQNLKHNGMVNSVWISDSEKYILSGCSDRLIYKWKFYYEESQFIKEQTLQGHRDEITSLCMAQRDSKIISGSKDCTIIVWEFAKNSYSHIIKIQLEGHLNAITCIRISSDEKLIISGSDDCTIRTWRMTTENNYHLHQVLGGHTKSINSVSLSSENRYFLTSGKDNTVKLWGDRSNEAKFNARQSLKGIKSRIGSIQISDSKKYIIAGTLDNLIKIWMRENGVYEPLPDLKWHRTPVYCAQISLNDSIIISTSRDETIAVWMSRRNEPGGETNFLLMQVLEGHHNAVTSAALAPDNSFIVSGSMDKTIKIWTRGKDGLYNESRMQEANFHFDFVSHVTVAMDNRTIISTSFDKTLKLWDYSIAQNTLTQHRLELEHKEPLYSACISKDMNYIVSCQQSGILSILKRMPSTSSLFYIIFQTLRGQSNNISSVSITSDNNYILTGSLLGDHLKIFKKSHDHYSEFLVVRTNNAQFTTISQDGELILHGSQSRKGNAKLTVTSFEPERLTFPEDYHILSLVQSVFTKDSKKSKEATLDLIHYIEESYPNSGIDDIFVHRSFNLLYFCIVLEYADCFKTSLTLFGYRKGYYVKGFDPLEYCLKVDNPIFLDIFSDYFTKNKISFEITEEMFLEGLGCSSDKFKIWISEVFFVKGRHFGIDLPEILRLRDVDDPYYFIEDQSFSKMQEFKDKLMQNDEREKRNGSPLTKAEYMTSNFEVNLGITSDFVIELLKQLDDTTDDVLLGNLSYLIKELWTRYKYLVMIYAVMHWMTTLIFFGLLLWDSNFLPMIIIGAIIIVVLFIYEVVVMSVDVKKYLSSPYNWLDIATYICVFLIIVILQPLDLIENNNKLHNLAITLVMLASAARSVTHLKVIDGIRYLIEMILKVFLDMRYFMLLLIVNILVFGGIFTYVDYTLNQDDVEDNRFKRLFFGIDRVYNIGYGAWDNSNEFNGIQYFYFVIGTTFFPLIMFNLLIAIISATFEKVEENKELTDIKGIVDVLLDYSYFASAIKKWIKKSHGASNIFYLHLIKELKEDQKEKVEKTIKDLNKEVKQLHEEILQIKSKLIPKKSEKPTPIMDKNGNWYNPESTQSEQDS